MFTRFKVEPSRLLCRAGIAVGALYLASCFNYPDSSERLNDDVVFTGHSKKADFGNYTTFAIDPVVHVATVGDDNKITTSDADSKFGGQIVSHVAKLLEDRGFQQVQSAEDPDLGVSVTGISGEQSGVVSGGYWSGYYSSYWGFPGYSYYYPYSTYYTYQTGTLVVDIADLADGRDLLATASSDDPEPGSLAVVWGMIAYRAYVPDDNASRVDAATTAIDQAFQQSPYLTRN